MSIITIIIIDFLKKMKIDHTAKDPLNERGGRVTCPCFGVSFDDPFYNLLLQCVIIIILIRHTLLLLKSIILV